MDTESYINELMSINALHLQTAGSHFRTDEGYCIDRFGREIIFSAPHEIDTRLHHLMAIFASEFRHADSLASLSLAFARVYYGLIAIHPFSNGNYRTACTFIRRRAHEKSYAVGSTDILRKILLEGATAEEMKKLMVAFGIILKPQ